MKGMASSLPVGAPPRCEWIYPGNPASRSPASPKFAPGAGAPTATSQDSRPSRSRIPPARPDAVTGVPPGRPAVSVMRSTSYQPNKPSRPKAFVDTPDIPGIGKALRRLSTHPEKFFRKRLTLLASTPIKGLNANIMGVWASLTYDSLAPTNLDLVKRRITHGPDSKQQHCFSERPA